MYHLYIEEHCDADRLHKLIMSLLRTYSLYEEGSFEQIKKYVDKKVYEADEATLERFDDCNPKNGDE